MEIDAKISNYYFEGSIKVADPVKVSEVLNKILINPTTALILEPAKNEYWIFFHGGIHAFEYNFGFELYTREIKEKEKKQLHISENTNQWNMSIIKCDGPSFTFFSEAIEVLDTIKNISTIKVATDQPYEKRKIYLHYKV